MTSDFCDNSSLSSYGLAVARCMLGVCKHYRARGTCCKRAEKEKEPAQVAEMVGRWLVDQSQVWLCLCASLISPEPFSITIK